MKKGSRDSALGSLINLAEARKESTPSSLPDLGRRDKLPASGCPRPHLPREKLRQDIHFASSEPSPCQFCSPPCRKKAARWRRWLRRKKRRRSPAGKKAKRRENQRHRKRHPDYRAEYRRRN